MVEKYNIVLRVMAEKVEALETENALMKWQIADLTAKLKEAEGAKNESERVGA